MYACMHIAFSGKQVHIHIGDSGINESSFISNMHVRSLIHLKQASIEYKIEHGFILAFRHTCMSVHACNYACIQAQMQANLHGCYFPVHMMNYSITYHFMYTSTSTAKTSLVEHKFTCSLNTKCM